MRTKATFALATSVLLQFTFPGLTFAADGAEAAGAHVKAADGAAVSDTDSAARDGAMVAAASGGTPADVMALDILRDGLAAPLGCQTSEMPLNAAFLMPMGDPAVLLRGDAKSLETKSDAGLQTKSGTYSQSKSGPNSETKSEMNSDMKSETNADAKSETSADAKSETSADAKSETSANAKPETKVALDGPIIIDNDLEKEAAVAEYVWRELPDSEGKMHIDAGGRFPVTVVTSHTSKTAKVGDPVEARLKVDIKIGGKLIAPKGTKVMGHIASCEKARKMIQAEFSTKRWMRPSGALGVQFDELLTAGGDHIPLIAMPAQQPRIVKNLAEGRVLGVNHKGEIVSPLSSQVKSQAAHLGIRAAASAAGPFSFGVVPIAYGVAGAISPSFAYMHPVGKNVRHRRLKGFGLGVVSGLPGGFLIADYMIRGEEAIIKPGDEFLAEFKQKFTGEASTDAQLMPNAKVKVHGEVMPGSDTNSKPAVKR